MSEHKKAGWFGSKKNQEDEERRQAAMQERKRRARAQLMQHVESLLQDPRFLVLTFDRLNWINPYTGQIVATPFEPEKQARDFLLQHQPWKNEKALLPLVKLTQIAWIHYLMRNMQSEHYLTIFKGDNWLNPFSGEWISDVPLDEHGKPNGETVKYLSKALNGDAQSANQKMLSNAELDRRAASTPFENEVEKQEHIEIYDGLIEEDESLCLDIDNIKKESTGHTPLSNPKINVAGEESDARLVAQINEMEDISGRQPIISSSQDALLTILPELPGLSLQQALVDGHSQHIDFAHSVILSDGKTLLLHGNVQVPDSASEAPVQQLRHIIDKAARFESEIPDILRLINQRVFQHFSGMLSVYAYAIRIDALDHHIDLGIAGMQQALAARLATGSLLNIIGESGPALGLQEDAFADYESLAFEMQSDDVLLLPSLGIYSDKMSQSLVGAAFVRALLNGGTQEPQETLDDVAEQLAGADGGVLLMIAANEIDDL